MIDCTCLSVRWNVLNSLEVRKHMFKTFPCKSLAISLHKIKRLLYHPVPHRFEDTRWLYEFAGKCLKHFSEVQHVHPQTIKQFVAASNSEEKWLCPRMGWPWFKYWCCMILEKYNDPLRIYCTWIWLMALRFRSSWRDVQGMHVLSIVSRCNMDCFGMAAKCNKMQYLAAIVSMNERIFGILAIRDPLGVDMWILLLRLPVPQPVFLMGGKWRQ